MDVYTSDCSGHGTVDYSFLFPRGVINRHSACVASVCELAKPPGEPLDYPFVGGATMRVDNIAPEDDGTVHVRFDIAWPSDLQWRVTFFVVT